MLTFDRGTQRFNFRSVAVILHDDHVLIHRAIADNFWALPGGRVEFFEHADDTVIREIEEELGMKAHITRPLWFLENFFEYDGKRYHEASMYFLVKLDEPGRIPFGEELPGIESGTPMVFKWFPLSELDTLSIKPVLLRERLRALPDSLEHIKHTELRDATE